MFDNNKDKKVIVVFNNSKDKKAISVGTQSFSIIKGVESLPLPYLIEMSHRKQTKRNNLDIFGGAVFDCVPGMILILCELQDKPQLSLYQNVIINEFVEYIDKQRTERSFDIDDNNRIFF